MPSAFVQESDELGDAVETSVLRERGSGDREICTDVAQEGDEPEEPEPDSTASAVASSCSCNCSITFCCS